MTFEPRTITGIDALPRVPLAGGPSPVERLDRLHGRLGGPRLLVKRDDALSFGFGGNKVRKLEFVAAEALRVGADTLVTCGGVQSNHARATAATAARLGLGAVLVANGTPPDRPTGNALLASLYGAEIRYVPTREDRDPAMRAIVAELKARGRRPFAIPLGASTPLGALGFVRAISELLQQVAPPDVIVHSTSSGGTQAGLVAGCALHGLPTQVIGISADEPAARLRDQIALVLDGVEPLAGAPPGSLSRLPIDIDDRFVGEGYGRPTPAATEALSLAATQEALLLDPVYTAKAFAGLLARVRGGVFRDDQTILFWHTGGLPAIFV